MGHPGWIFSRGLDYTKRNDEIVRMYAGAPDAEALLRQFAVEYVLIGPQERTTLKVDDQFWSHYRKVAGNGSYVLLKTNVSQERAGK